MLRWLLLLSVVGAAQAQEAEPLLARARAVNPGLKDYQAELRLQLEADLGPLHYQQPLAQANYFYKREQQHKLEVVRGPRQLKRYPSIFGMNLPPASEYQASLQGTGEHRGRPVYFCRLQARSPEENLAQIDLVLDRQTFTIPHYEQLYRSQGKVLVDIDFVKMGPFWVYQHLEAEADFPSASSRAKGQADYSNYQFNQNLSDRIFSYLHRLEF